jgi:hypothetical protein
MASPPLTKGLEHRKERLKRKMEGQMAETAKPELACVNCDLLSGYEQIGRWLGISRDRLTSTRTSVIGKAPDCHPAQTSPRSKKRTLGAAL